MSRNRPKLLERMQAISERLTDPDIPEDLLEHYYAELKEINAQLSADDAERRAKLARA